MPEQPAIATWSPVRDLWETDQVGLFSEQPDAFSEIWPASGMTRRGRLFPLPRSGPVIDATGCSSSLLLPTPVANDSGNSPEVHLRKKPGRKVVTSLAIICEHDLFSTGGELP